MGSLCPAYVQLMSSLCPNWTKAGYILEIDCRVKRNMVIDDLYIICKLGESNR
jgi:hypothetical protein